MLTADARARMEAVKAKIAAGREGYHAAMIAARGNEAQMRIALEADREIRDLWAVIRDLENERELGRLMGAARKEGR